MMPRWQPLKERFEQAVVPEPNSGCWLWNGWVNRTGYGCIGDGSRNKRLATHVALELVGRPVPDGMGACHTCDNTYCVNPDHLFIGSQKDNAQDALRKGRLTKPPTRKPGQGRKEFCRNGHPMTEDNRYIWNGKSQGCRLCANLRGLARHHGLAAVRRRG